MWTYLTFDDDGDPLPDSPTLPPPGSVFLAFESLRWQVMIGYIEAGDYRSVLSPNVNDDCNLVAWAPLSERSEPDIELIRRNVWHEELGPEYEYRSAEWPTLLRE